MRRKIALLVAFTLLAATTASGQFVDNGGEAGSADTSAFGQSTEFSNVTTTFDGIELQVLRLIREPSDPSKLRLVGQFISANSEPRWIQMYGSYPRLLDDLGNEYVVTSWSGIDACREREKSELRWWRELAECAGEFQQNNVSNQNSGESTLVAQDVPVAFSLVFAPANPEQGLFEKDLAALSTSLTASFSFVVAIKNFSVLEKRVNKDMAAYQVVVPSIPVPQP